MKFISKEEYLQLIESAQIEEEYDQSDNYNVSDAWMPAKSPNKEKMLRAKASSYHGTIDILTYRTEQIRDIIYKCMSLKIGEFIIHIRKYNGHPKDKQLFGPLTLDIRVMQEKYLTPSGTPCQMSYKFDFFQDNRFTKCPWISYFNSSGHATDIPIETVIQIIRWMQGLKRLSAFI